METRRQPKTGARVPRHELAGVQVMEAVRNENFLDHPETIEVLEPTHLDGRRGSDQRSGATCAGGGANSFTTRGRPSWRNRSRSERLGSTVNGSPRRPEADF